MQFQFIVAAKVYIWQATQKIFTEETIRLNERQELYKNGGEVIPATNKKINLFNLKIIVAAIVCYFAFSRVFASLAESDKLACSLVVCNLSPKLKSDLAQNDVLIKLLNDAQRAVSRNIIEIKGNGVCLISEQNNQPSIRF